MAIKDQCKKCKHYQDSALICNITSATPVYNCSSCEQYDSNERKGIDLSKGSNSAHTSPTIAPGSSANTPNYQTPNTRNGSSNNFIKHLFSFKGRIGRLEYFLTFIIYTFAYAMPMQAIPADDLSAGFSLVWLLLFVPAIWILYAQGAKRSHDIGNSGWYQLIPFYILWMTFAKGDKHDNEYGPSRK